SCRRRCARAGRADRRSRARREPSAGQPGSRPCEVLPMSSATLQAIGNVMKGVVVAPQPVAAEIGADLLARGGNAFDAAIGAAFIQTVTDPQMCGLGGFGCATYASPGVCQHLAFHARAGSRATPDMWAADFRGRTDLGGYT